MNNKTIEQKIQRTEKEITRLEHQKKIKQHEATRCFFDSPATWKTHNLLIG